MYKIIYIEENWLKWTYKMKKNVFIEFWEFN